MSRHSKIDFEYNKITEYIYIGTNMCCQGHFAKELLVKGIKADISLDDKNIDAPFGVDYFLWLPTTNHKAPTQKQLKMGVELIKDLEKNKVHMYVHCERGHGRAPTLVAAYLAKYKKMTVKEAFNFIKRKRSVIHPEKNQISAVELFRKS